MAILSAVGFNVCSGSRNNQASNTPSAPARHEVPDDLRGAISRVEPFFKPMGKPKPYDWLGSHNEPGQTFDQYTSSNPTLPTDERRTIYVLPLGKFNAQQRKIIDITSGYLEAFYNLPVKELPAQLVKRPTDKKDTRTNPYTKVVQIRTGHIIDSILKPKLPSDAAAMIGLTNEDLFPDDSMNYVFGQGSFADRVGIYSLSRLDDNDASYDTFLRRTFKIAAHETGHMFGMWHCTKYECVMSGTNYLGETDSRPIDACPECMAKVCRLSHTSPKDRYDRLASFCRKNGLAKEADDFERKSKAVR
ncbi:MAG: archaemetzincin [Acidobacteriota bacterium]